MVKKSGKRKVPTEPKRVSATEQGRVCDEVLRAFDAVNRALEAADKALLITTIEQHRRQDGVIQYVAAVSRFMRRVVPGRVA